MQFHHENSETVTPGWHGIKATNNLESAGENTQALLKQNASLRESRMRAKDPNADWLPISFTVSSRVVTLQRHPVVFWETKVLCYGRIVTEWSGKDGYLWPTLVRHFAGFTQILSRILLHAKVESCTNTNVAV